MRVDCKSFIFKIKAKDIIVLPSYKGSTFRGGFGNAFRRVVCALKKSDCGDCLLKERCIYSYIFETPPPSQTKVMTKYTTAPHPFIIEPPNEKRLSYAPDDTLTFRLTLIGKAIDYLPYFIYSFEELGNIGIGKGRGRFELAEVKSRDSEAGSQDTKSSENIIYSSDSKTLKTSEKSFIDLNFDSGLSAGDSKLITLDFLTPARIIYDNHLLLDLEFHIIIRQLLRRIALLAYFHCGHDTSEIDFNGIIERAKEVKVRERNLKWHDWERYSARQDTRMKMGGFVGDITFEGCIEPFMSIIRAGEVLHVGKGTSFGLGEYTIKKYC